jgi:dienelactone hydrolase
MHMQLKEEAIDYRDGDAELSGLLVWDGHECNQPGVLVVHGGAGLDDHAKTRARQLAEVALLVFTCDMYGKAVIGDRERVMSCIHELVANRDTIARRAEAGVDVLTTHPLFDGNIAAVGYCFGGRAALELARTAADLVGVISVHGSLETAQPARAGTSRPRCSSARCSGSARPDRATHCLHRRDERRGGPTTS